MESILILGVPIGVLVTYIVFVVGTALADWQQRKARAKEDQKDLYAQRIRVVRNAVDLLEAQLREIQHQTGNNTKAINELYQGVSHINSRLSTFKETSPGFYFVERPEAPNRVVQPDYRPGDYDPFERAAEHYERARDVLRNAGHPFYDLDQPMLRHEEEK